MIIKPADTRMLYYSKVFLVESVDRYYTLTLGLKAHIEAYMVHPDP